LPFLTSPFISEITFLKNIENRDGKIKKEYFKNNRIKSPFYIFIKLNEAENKNTLFVKFYNSENNMIKDLFFEFGKKGKFYEYIIFTDKITELKPEKYRYIIAINKCVIYENEVIIR
jgi:hypothetical protein